MLSSASELEDVRPLTRAFRALGDETRIRIIALLVHGELCVCHLESALGISQPNCSRHLAILKAAGIVDSRRDGTWVYYRISDQEHESVKAVLDAVAKTFGAERALRTDHARLQKNCGPNACK
jgi:ArsR family transcriptional regulator, arsenate/arsenite/antimonite-responsive transcriptional repressor